MSQDQKRDPKISPLYTNMSKLKLPPALFNCGTLDPLLDDTVMMSTKWMMSGAESILRIFPGKFRDGPIVIMSIDFTRCTARLYNLSTERWDRDGKECSR